MRVDTSKYGDGEVYGQWHDCPNCSKAIAKVMIEEEPTKYCPYCGVGVDWSGANA